MAGAKWSLSFTEIWYLVFEGDSYEFDVKINNIWKKVIKHRPFVFSWLIYYI